MKSRSAEPMHIAYLLWLKGRGGGRKKIDLEKNELAQLSEISGLDLEWTVGAVGLDYSTAMSEFNHMFLKD